MPLLSVEDKIIKNHYAAEYIYNTYKETKTCGVIEEDKSFGIKKIVMGLCCEDEKVSVDEIIEIMQEKYPEEVQSVEIVSFNKI